MRCTLTLVSIGFFLACARPAPQVGTPDGVPRSPVPPPEVGVDNCVESKELKAFVLALEERRVAARDSALAALGARREVRRGIFAEPASRPLGEVFEQGGQRFAVVAHYTADSEPTVALALQGNAVRRLEERPRAHGVPIRALRRHALPRR